MRPPCPGAPLLPQCFCSHVPLTSEMSSPSSVELILPGEVGELRGSSSPAPRGDPEGFMAPIKDKLGSHNLWEGVWEVQATCLVGTGEEVTQPLDWRSQQQSVCTVRLVLSRSLFLFPDTVHSSRNQMLEMGEDLVEIGDNFLAPCSALAPPHCSWGVFQACVVLGLARGRGRYRRVCGAQKLHILGWRVPPGLCWCHQ